MIFSKELDEERKRSCVSLCSVWGATSFIWIIMTLWLNKRRLEEWTHVIYERIRGSEYVSARINVWIICLLLTWFLSYKFRTRVCMEYSNLVWIIWLLYFKTGFWKCLVKWVRLDISPRLSYACRFLTVDQNIVLN